MWKKTVTKLIEQKEKHNNLEERQGLWNELEENWGNLIDLFYEAAGAGWLQNGNYAIYSQNRC